MIYALRIAVNVSNMDRLKLVSTVGPRYMSVSTIIYFIYNTVTESAPPPKKKKKSALYRGSVVRLIPSNGPFELALSNLKTEAEGD